MFFVVEFTSMLIVLRYTVFISRVCLEETMLRSV